MMKQNADISLVNGVKDGFRFLAVFDDQVKVDIKRIPASFAGNGQKGLADDLWGLGSVQKGNAMPLAVS